MRIAIVEDEDQSAELLENHIRRYEAEHQVRMETEHFRDGLNFLDHYQADFDIVFMDIEMPHLDGMSAAKRLRELDENVCLIFVTNLASYAIRGYEVSAMDFIVKPVRYFSFSMKLDRAVQLRHRRERNELVLPAEESMRRLDLADVAYIEVRNHTLVYHTVAGGTISLRGTISAEEKKLADKGFARSANSYLVNLAKVSAVGKKSLTVCGEELPISRTQKEEFMRALADYVGNS